LGGVEEAESGAWGEAWGVAEATGFEEILEVVEECWGGMDLADAGLEFEEGGSVGDGGERAEHFSAIGAEEHEAFGGAVGDAEFDAHGEAIELGFWEGESADLVLGILGGDDEERGRKGVG